MKMIFWIMGFMIFSLGAWAADSDFSYRNQSEFKAHDYLFKRQELRRDPVFDEYRTVDVGVNLGIGSDCGRVDFKSTLQASLKNILDSRYFGDMGKDIIAGSPMLLTCYFSPTWCAILKHSQVNANFMSQMRLNQCSLMDKYTDSRVQEFYEERQSCVHREIERNGGNIESAMQTCNSSRMWDTNIANWSGSKYGEKTDSNKLISSSARWAGLDTPAAASTLNLVKNLVGDTVVSRGRVSVEYGDKPFGITPRTHLAGIEREIQERLCQGLLKKIDGAGPQGANQVIRGANLEAVTGIKNQVLLDRQTLRNLAVLPYRARSLYCQRLASSIAVARFSDDMNRSLDVLTLAAQNPNLPERRKKEIEDKCDQLKNSVAATIELQRERNSPLNEVVAQINQEGDGLHQELSRDRLVRDQVELDAQSARSRFFDCADGVMCDQAGGGL
ncbi:MAG: hypothetical protein KF865_03240 [Bdellovibrionaceae bacterium]|nr:hypothetical protein [Pseudobdellovibrionaceae bacterium]